MRFVLQKQENKKFVLETREHEICNRNKRTRDLYQKQENMRLVLETAREDEICTKNKRT